MASIRDLVVGTGQVKRGRLFIQHRSLFNRQVAELDERWMLEVTVARLRATRSIEANRYYFGVVIDAISAHTGYHPDETHDLMKMLHLPKELAICDGNGEVKGQYVMGGSTRNLNTAEFSAYVSRVQQWAAETLDVVIPDAR
jgi:hypothetical protein